MKPILRKERRFYRFVEGKHPESRLVVLAGMRLYEAYPWDREEYEKAPLELGIISNDSTFAARKGGAR